VLFPR